MNERMLVLLLVCSLGLSACLVLPGEGQELLYGSSIKPAPTIKAVPYELAEKHWSDVAKLKSEATRLALKIAANEITKVEAARQLGAYRLQLVGSNVIDDDMYRTYLNAAIDRMDGKISNLQSINLVKNSLNGWYERWERMSDSQKPNNPAFTNFLNETMGLPYLK